MTKEDKIKEAFKDVCLREDIARVLWKNSPLSGDVESEVLWSSLDKPNADLRNDGYVEVYKYTMASRGPGHIRLAHMFPLCDVWKLCTFLYSDKDKSTYAKSVILDYINSQHAITHGDTEDVLRALCILYNNAVGKDGGDD